MIYLCECTIILTYAQGVHLVSKTGAYYVVSRKKSNVFITFYYALGLSFGHLTVMGANRFEWVHFCAIVLQ